MLEAALDVVVVEEAARGRATAGAVEDFAEGFAFFFFFFSPPSSPFPSLASCDGDKRCL